MINIKEEYVNWPPTQMPFASDILASVFRQKYVDAVRLLYQFVTIMKRETHSPEDRRCGEFGEGGDSKIPTLRRWGGVPGLDLFGNRIRTPVTGRRRSAPVYDGEEECHETADLSYARWTP
jgi:hypothetical protein